MDNILLLLLRALAILLITAAFARPFFRQESLLDRALDGRNIAMLIDSSASMQRADVWASAKEQATKLMDSLSPADRISLYTVDDALHPIVAFDTERKTDAASQQKAVRAAVADLQPTWRGSKVAEGLRSLTDLFQAASIAGKIDAASQNELVFISDLHVNCGVESLQGYPWPESVRLEVRQVRPKQPGNARASLATKDEDSKENEDRIKVRVENNSDSAEQSFELKWMAGSTLVAGAQTTLQVPPGQVRMIPVPTQPTNADRLELSGDSWAGDNTLFVAKPLPKREKIAFVGEELKNKETDLAYFLAQAPLSTGLVRRTVERVARDELASLLAASSTADLTVREKLKAVIIEPPFSEADAKALREFASSGGCVIACLARPMTDGNAIGQSIERLLANEQVTVSEAVTKDFALLSAIDYTSPVFKPFADPRFNDFSKVRVWAHRRLEFKEKTDKSNLVQTIASLDDGSAWLLRNPVGSGNVWIMTSGWQPASSQFGLSSKFVPILLGMLDPSGKSLSAQLVYSVGDEIPVSDLPDLAVSKSDGSPVEVAASGGTLQLDAPGLYNLQSSGIRRQVAVQIPGSEVQLTPMDVDVFDQYGVEMGKVKSDTERKQSARQLQAIELEQKQRVWQWLLLAGLLVLALETVLAGLFARKSSQSNVRIEPQTAG